MVENLRIQDPAIPTETIQKTQVNVLKKSLKKLIYMSNNIKMTVQAQNNNII